MNKQKQERERRKILDLVKHSSLSGNKVNCFRIYNSEGLDHIKKKFEVWLKLRKSGYDVWCEPIFKNETRMDLLAFKDGVFTNYEILSSETIKELNKKTKKYPDEINIIPVMSNSDIKNLEMY